MKLATDLVAAGFDVDLDSDHSQKDTEALVRGIGKVWFGSCGPRESEHYHITSFKTVGPNAGKILDLKSSAYHLSGEFCRVVDELQRRVNRATPTVDIVDCGTHRVTRTVRTIHIAGVKFTSDDRSLIEDLCEASYMEPCVVYDEDWVKAAYQAGLIDRSSRGGVWATERLRKNRDAIEAALEGRKHAPNST